MLESDGREAGDDTAANLREPAQTRKQLRYRGVVYHGRNAGIGYHPGGNGSTVGLVYSVAPLTP